LLAVRYQHNAERRLYIVKELLARGANPAIPYNEPHDPPGSGNIVAEVRKTKDPALVAVLEEALKKRQV
jgi:hypothetical protein